MFRSLNEVLRVSRKVSKVSKSTRVADDHGIPASSAADEKLIFREHVADLLGGEACTMESLFLEDRKISSNRYDNIDPKCLARAVPAIPDLVLIFNTFVRGKAFWGTSYLF